MNDVAVETPLDLAANLSARTHNRIYFKREDMQPVFSFKIRGAYNKMAHLSPQALKRGVICASAGNHAQGVALSAAKLGVRAVIVMPSTTPQIKIDAVKARGGEVVLLAILFRRLRPRARTRKGEKLTFIHPSTTRRDRRPGHGRHGDPAPAPGRSTRCSAASAAAA